MSEQAGTEATTKRRRTRQTHKQDGTQPPTFPRPANEDKEAWRTYWAHREQPWRTEPEIDLERQKYLAERRSIKPDIDKGVYPFRGIELSRADVEWLLATHENGRGPVDWNDTKQREREGLDLRGADLRQVDLSRLPLARLRGGLTMQESVVILGDQHDSEKKCQQGTKAAVHLEEAYLFTTHLEGADLSMAQMERAKMQGAYLEDADLSMAQLKEAILSGAHLKHASLGAAHLEKGRFFMAWLEEANLSSTNLENANFFGAHLERALLIGTHLKKTNFQRTHLDGATLDNITLGDERHVGPQLADIQWGNVNLALVKWSQIEQLGDEYQAQQKKTSDGNMKDATTQLHEYRTAVRANRQLAVVLQDQGLSEEAARFAYRSQVCKQRLLFLQLLQQIAEAGILRWLLRTPQKSQDYWSLLPITTMLVVFTFVFLVYSFMLRDVFTSWSMGVILSLSVCLCLALLVTYQVFVRLLLLFLLLSALDLVLLYLAFLLLITTLIDSTWRLNLFFLLLMVAVITTLFWSVHAEPLASRFGIKISVNDRIKILWKNGIKIYRAFFCPWIVPFAQLQLNYGRYVFALFLNLLAGYGYKPGRSLLGYLVVIFGFATSYYAIGHIPLLPNAFVLSLTSFHGRGFFPGLESKTTLDNPLVVLAAIEAVVGLFIEISFIATFTQRFFGK